MRGCGAQRCGAACLSLGLAAAIGPAMPTRSAWRRPSIPTPSRAWPATPQTQLNIGKSIFYQRAHQHHRQRPGAGASRRRLDLHRRPRLRPRHRQIRLRPEERSRRDQRLLLQGRDALRRRQDLEERGRRHRQYAGRRARHPRRHRARANQQPKEFRLYAGLWRLFEAPRGHRVSARLWLLQQQRSP